MYALMTVDFQTTDIKIKVDKWAKEKILDLKEFYMTREVSNYNTSPLRATDNFGRSLSYYIGHDRMEIYTNVDYLEAMTEGTSPAQAKLKAFDTLYRDLIEWATSKPVKVEGKVTDFAFKAARSIYKHGTTIWQLYGAKGKDTGLVSETFNEQEIDELFIDLSDVFFNIVNKELKASVA